MRRCILISVCLLFLQHVVPVGAVDSQGFGEHKSDVPRALLRKSDSKVIVRQEGDSITISPNRSTLEEILQRIAGETKIILNFYCDDPVLKRVAVANLRISADSLVKALGQMLPENLLFTPLNREGKPTADKKEIAAVDVYPEGCARVEHPVRVFVPERGHPLLRKSAEETSLEELRDVLRREGPSSRRLAAEILGIKSDEKGIAYAKEALKDENIGVMIAAANALMRLGQKYGFEKVAGAVYDRFREKPYGEFLSVMVEVDKDKIWPVIDGLMDQPGEREQGIIARALVLTNDRKAIKYLSKIASTGTAENSGQAILGIGKIGGTEAATVLIMLLREGDVQRQARAAQAVYLLPRPDASNARVEVERIVREGRVSDALIQALVEGQDLEPIKKLMEDPASQPELKIKALQALANRGTEKTIEVVAAGLNDKSPQVRIASVVAMGVLAVEEVVPHLIRAVGDTDPKVRSGAAKALSAFPGDDGVMRALGKALYDADESVRKQAVDSFGLLGQPTEEATALLKECKNHKDPYVAKKASSILQYWNLEGVGVTKPGAAKSAGPRPTTSP